MHFNDQVNFELIKDYNSIEELKKEYTSELVWLSNSSKYSIFDVNEENIYALIHRDSGRVELAKKHRKYYNYIRRLRISISSIKDDCAEYLEESIKLSKKLDDISKELTISEEISGVK